MVFIIFEFSISLTTSRLETCAWRYIFSQLYKMCIFYINNVGACDRMVHHLLWPVCMILYFIFMYNLIYIKKCNLPFHWNNQLKLLFTFCDQSYLEIIEAELLWLSSYTGIRLLACYIFHEAAYGLCLGKKWFQSCHLI